MTNPQHAPANEAPIGELMTQLTAQTTRLLRDEMRLARVELIESAKRTGAGAGLVSAAGVLALFGLGCTIAALVASFSMLVPVWAAAVIVALFLFAASGVTALVGKKQVDQALPTPERTIANVRQDINEVKDARHDH